MLRIFGLAFMFVCAVIVGAVSSAARANHVLITEDEAKLPPAKDSDKGHFHAECAEFWIILKGQMNYRIEGAPEIVADEGDVVYTPRGHWHRARFHGPGQSCRLAMNGFQDIGHYFEAE